MPICWLCVGYLCFVVRLGCLRCLFVGLAYGYCGCGFVALFGGLRAVYSATMCVVLWCFVVCCRVFTCCLDFVIMLIFVLVIGFYFAVDCCFGVLLWLGCCGLLC